jgi:hypothetical protein
VIHGFFNAMEGFPLRRSAFYQDGALFIDTERFLSRWSAFYRDGALSIEMERFLSRWKAFLHGVMPANAGIHDFATMPLLALHE